MIRAITLVSIVFAIVGCVSNPLNRVTSDNYAETCSIAEKRSNLEVAEEACHRALVNADWGNLGEGLKSEKLYNLARIKRRLSKFQEAEKLLDQSLGIERKRTEITDLKIGRRLVELSVNLAAQDRWNEGITILEEALTIADQYSGNERNYVVLVLNKYGEYLNSNNQAAKGKLFKSHAKLLAPK